MPASWGRIYCLSGSGNVEWVYPSSGWIECIDSPPSIADVDEDGRPEVIFGAWYGKVYVLNGEDGSLVWQRGYCDNGYVQTAPCIVDCDSDGHLDIVIGMFRGDCKIYALSGQNGDTLWTYQAADWMYAGPATADIDADGLPELVIGDYSGAVFALNAEDGSFKWTRTIGYYVFPPVTIAELDPQSAGPEILAAMNTLYCLSAEGDILWTHPTGGLIDRGAVVAEIDGDISPEVIFGSSDCRLRVVNGEDGSLVWSKYTDPGYPIENAPVVADFDNDGYNDVFCIGGRGYSDTIPNYGRAYAISSASGGGDTWTMYRHDVYRTGSQFGFQTDINVPPAQLPYSINMKSYPNPFNSSTTIEFTLPEESEIELAIYDILGRKIANLFTGQKEAGNFSFIWDAGDKPSGVYLASLKSKEYSKAVKILLLR
jgi:outer membrane protein assembly factor BamB